MTNEELLFEARNSFKSTNSSASLIRRLADALESAEARVKELEAERDASDRAFRALKDQSAACDVERLEIRGRIAELEAQVKDLKCEQVFRISEMQELVEAQARIAELEAERDAATAAVERVQETLSLHNPNGRLVKEVLAALDGAPEPEEKP